MGKFSVRIESDSMGDIAVPADALYGASTMRAVNNFPISDMRLSVEFYASLAIIKLCAAQVNGRRGSICDNVAEGIISAAREVIDGKWEGQFPVDVFQTGSGTSSNMNMNEVLARRSRQILGLDENDRSRVHPNDHVNLGQSSNDVIPSAIHLSALTLVRQQLLPALTQLSRSLTRKSRQFETVVKVGRTHLQEATPVTLGQEFSGYSAQIKEARRAIKQSSDRLARLALGGTAVGTGINTEAGFAADVCKLISQEVGFKVTETPDHFRAQSSLDDIVLVSGSLKMLAVALMKICNDLRWMGSGPAAGLGEIRLPAVQPGSSIMPGKVNPVIPESALMACVQVIGYEAAITAAAQSGNFELNVMLPVVAFDLLASIKLLAASCKNLRSRCIEGIEATEVGPSQASKSIAMVTALAPEIGYDEAARIAKLALTRGLSIMAIALEETDLGEEKLSELLDPARLTKPGSKT